MPYSNIDSPKKYFDTKLYTGTGATQSITGLSFKPDFTWLKHRNNATVYSHQLYDAVRGATNYLVSNTTAQENDAGSSCATCLTSFNSDGFSLGSNAGINASGVNHVSWNWLGANTTVSNTSGSITSTVSASTISGFSIVSYTGNATAGATVGHGLGVVPKMIILKRRTGSDEDWYVYHGSLANTEVLRLNLGNAKATRADFNNTTPTSSVFTINSSDNVNASGSTFIAYCFADVKGYSKFSSYTGNGSTDGTFIYTGFSPAFVIFKNATTANRHWYMMDNKRNTYNVANIVLTANFGNDESWWGTGNNIDFLSNGIKIRSNSDINNSGDNFIYMAFAENPFVSSKSIPTTAR
jgi:hypothetical protein